ncbi:VPS4-associated protein 1 [Corynascus similis CBS 632.67]
MSFPNIYTHRKVAETKAKSCDICFKISSSVLITPDNKDWFYVCPAHLKDPGFCTPKIDQATIDARKKRELEEEIERVKKEYEEKQKKKKEKEEKGKKEDETGDKNTKDDKANEDKEKKTPVNTELSKDDTTSSLPQEEEPRVFELKSTFYQQRLNKKRQAEITRRNRERLQDPNFFPSVPKKLP